MAHRKEPSKKVLEKHAKFLAAWETGDSRITSKYEGASLNRCGQPRIGIGNKSEKPLYNPPST